MVYVIKSTLCLTILYVFYWFFLRNVKSLAFNRYYLLFSLLFASVVPVVSLGSLSGLALNINLDRLFGAGKEAGLPGAAAESHPQQHPGVIIAAMVYGVISCFLLIRYLRNIFRLALTLRKNPVVRYYGTRLVLVDEAVS